jgi:hypothetical protein
MLPTIQRVVTGMLDGAADQERLLRSARPYSLDEHTLDEVRRVFSENDRGGADHAVFEQQITRWQRDHPGTEGLEELAADVAKLRPAYQRVLDATDEHRGHTIEALMGSSDAEVGLGTLLGDIPLPGSQRPPR